MELTFLGTGTSHGIPVIGCGCEVCMSGKRKNNRTRTSVWIQAGNASFTIDTGPEFRIQALRENIKKIDFVLITHSHADHIHGIEDLRSLSRVKSIPVYGNSFSIDEIRTRFSYIWHNTEYKGEKPKLDLTEIQSSDSIFVDFADGASCIANEAHTKSEGSLKGVIIKPIPVKHGNLDVFGYRIGSLSYITDCNYIPPGSMEIVKGSEILVIGALRRKPHPTHFSVDEALKKIEESGCKKAFFTHICHDIDHKTLKKELPKNIRPAYDGLKIVF
jgi:phosphoribosyl 1,2-cyclic phosphate phosphodiesterase